MKKNVVIGLVTGVLLVINSSLLIWNILEKEEIKKERDYTRQQFFVLCESLSRLKSNEELRQDLYPGEVRSFSLRADPQKRTLEVVLIANGENVSRHVVHPNGVIQSFSRGLYGEMGGDDSPRTVNFTDYPFWAFFLEKD